jgi:hypothetical protein
MLETAEATVTESERLTRIEADISEIKTALNTIAETVTKVGDQVMPMVEELAQNPMISMLMGGK